jgi:hypothetical protein
MAVRMGQKSAGKVLKLAQLHFNCGLCGTTFSIVTFSIMTLSITTLIIKALFAKLSINNIQHE